MTSPRGFTTRRADTNRASVETIRKEEEDIRIRRSQESLETRPLEQNVMQQAQLTVTPLKKEALKAAQEQSAIESSARKTQDDTARHTTQTLESVRQQTEGSATARLLSPKIEIIDEHEEGEVQVEIARNTDYANDAAAPVLEEVYSYYDEEEANEEQEWEYEYYSSIEQSKEN